MLDLLVAAPTGEALPRDPAGEAEIISALAERLGLSEEDLRASKLFEPLPPTGNAFFDSEEEIFLDRFAFSNVRPRLKVQKIYATGKMQAGGVQMLAVRVRNESAFPVASHGEHPVYLSYHWLDAAGKAVAFEGRRTHLPVDVKPGQAITAHVQVEAPSEYKRLSLKVVPVQELVSWLEDDGETVEIEFSSAPPPSLPRFDDDRPFSEALDDVLSAQFLGRHLDSASEPILGLEIGGGTMAALSRWAWANGGKATVINGDVSVRLLRIAALLSAKGGDTVTLHARFDANSLPIQAATLDAAVFCRSLHHFEDPVRVMRECRRVLKPDGLLFLLCEPVATEYDEPTKALIRAGVNEQMFPLDAYDAMIADAGFKWVDAACDWGFSLKAALRKAG
ncbi:class I SAM-dependent methyltransferase [Methylocystis parvus]|uniref:class I SAM-dependent methyltransferase n=1 Tax=Methylocystis parvus TaxID=134 RepID=UPI003C75CB46